MIVWMIVENRGKKKKKKNKKKKKEKKRKKRKKMKFQNEISLAEMKFHSVILDAPVLLGHPNRATE